jgi:hypothetical protein
MFKMPYVQMLAPTGTNTLLMYLHISYEKALPTGN